MAAGRAIIAPDQPNIREVLEQGRTALLFDPANPEAMWQGIETLARDAALRARLGAAAREEVLRRDFTWAGNARRVVALAEGALDGRKDGPTGMRRTCLIGVGVIAPHPCRGIARRAGRAVSAVVDSRLGGGGPGDTAVSSAWSCSRSTR